MEAERWILMYNENRKIFDYTYADNVTGIIELFKELPEGTQKLLKERYNLTEEFMNNRLLERMM